MFYRYYGCPVFEADDHVHELFKMDRTLLTLIKKTFPNVIDENGVNHRRLSEKVMEEPQALDWLEGVVHSRVDRRLRAFLRRHVRREMVIVVIPLLFEKRYRVMASIVATASEATQRLRVMRRQGMTKEKFEFFRRRQWSDRRKKRHADFILPTGGGYALTLKRLRDIILILKTRKRLYERNRFRLGNDRT